ncbi:hypothetical protein [Vibrio cortegadensis]|uniref:hypothetical protein n=1 Tax=Vibrio cortegadensis TaxID=1328770 RepID=UPI00352F42E8
MSILSYPLPVDNPKGGTTYQVAHPLGMMVVIRKRIVFRWHDNIGFVANKGITPNINQL